MPKRATSFDLPLPARDRRVPAYRWLYEALRGEILAGRLHGGARLPSTRDLAARHALARGTAVLAYEQLQAEGYVEGGVGSGTYVSRTLPDDLLRVPPAGAQPTALSRRRPALSVEGRRVCPFSVLETRPSRAFRPNLPALDLFPTALWAQVGARRLRRASASLLLGCDAMGYRPLQEAVSGYLRAARGVVCRPDQIAIVSGVQEALDIAARLLLDPGDRAALEDPGYPGAARTFEAAGARLVRARSDEDGVLPSDAALRGVRLVYTTPAHQFPLGTTMGAARRLMLLDWARRASAFIFEDDYDAEFRYAGRPVPALQGLDRDGRVLFAGSFSKVLFPSLRLGYLVVPPALVESVAALKSITSRHPPVLEQAILCDFIADGHFARHLRRMRQIYAGRLEALFDAARAHLSGLLAFPPIEAGLQTAAWLAPGIDAEAAAAAAATRGVEVTPLSRYALRPMRRQGLQLGFAAVDEAAVRRGVRELAAALSSVAPSRR